jgi:hypothetical protein
MKKTMKQSEVPGFLKEVRDSFAEQMSRVPVKKKTLEDLKAGFSDGVRACLYALKEKGHLTIEDDEDL